MIATVSMALANSAVRTMPVLFPACCRLQNELTTPASPFTLQAGIDEFPLRMAKLLASNRVHF